MTQQPVAPPAPGADVLVEIDEFVLLRGFAAGDPACAQQFVERFQRRVLQVARAICADPSVADDVVQVTFERVWRLAFRYDLSRGSVSSWVAAIARNSALDLRRRHRDDPVDPHSIEWIAGSDQSPEVAAASQDAIERVHARIERLPEAQRRAVVLATMTGLTSSEIARVEGVPVSTAKSRVQAGLRQLRPTAERELC